MKNKINLTSHTIVKNDEKWIWYAIMSVKDYVAEMFVHDDGSTDDTLKIIKSINDPKIKLTSGNLTSQGFTDMRNEMVNKTKTDWFLLLDGDEIWNYSSISSLSIFISTLSADKYGVVMPTRNCVGDVYHYLPFSAGKYHLLGRTGTMNMRAIKKMKNYSWFHEYPPETYVDDKGVSLVDQENNLSYFDEYYWHMTHLQRSSVRGGFKGYRNQLFETGLNVKSVSEFPEVFKIPHPEFVSDPFVRRSLGYEAVSGILSPIRKVKQILTS